MKKLLCYLILLNLIPYIFIMVFMNKKQNSEIDSVKQIKVLKTIENIVVDMDFEEYIKGVTYAEMPASFESEAIKAQAVAARTYTYRKIGQRTHENGEICDDPGHCQAFREKDNTANYNKVSEAVDATHGEVITYNGNVINALFHAASGGKTENANNVWDSNEIFYLTSVESPGEEEIMKDFTTEVKVKKDEFINKIKEIKKDLIFSEDIEIKSINESGSVDIVRIGNIEFSGVDIRNIFGLRSAKFEINMTNDTINFVVKGYGHGVGLSQWGAQAMALKNKNYKEILKHYYLGTEIVKV